MYGGTLTKAKRNGVCVLGNVLGAIFVLVAKSAVAKSVSVPNVAAGTGVCRLLWCAGDPADVTAER